MRTHRRSLTVLATAGLLASIVAVSAVVPATAAPACTYDMTSMEGYDASGESLNVYERHGGIVYPREVVCGGAGADAVDAVFGTFIGRGGDDIVTYVGHIDDGLSIYTLPIALFLLDGPPPGFGSISTIERQRFFGADSVLASEGSPVRIEDGRLILDVPASRMRAAAIPKPGRFVGGAGNDMAFIVRNGSFVGGGGGDQVYLLDDGHFDGNRGRDSAYVMTGGSFYGDRWHDAVYLLFGGRVAGGLGDDSINEGQLGGYFFGGPGEDVIAAWCAGRNARVEHVPEPDEEMCDEMIDFPF